MEADSENQVPHHLYYLTGKSQRWVDHCFLCEHWIKGLRAIRRVTCAVDLTDCSGPTTVQFSGLYWRGRTVLCVTVVIKSITEQQLKYNLFHLHWTLCLFIFSLCLLMYLLFFSTYALPLSVFVFKLFLYPNAFFFVCKADSQPHCCFPFLLVGLIHSSLPFSSGLKHYGLPK